MYDYLIVGAGLSGATFATLAHGAGKRCLVVDRRSHIGGNCHTETIEGISVHKYGPHLFHTNSKRIWSFVNAFASFNDYHHTVVAKTRAGVFSLPINLVTLSALFSIHTPEQARNYFAKVQEPHQDDSNVEGWCYKNIGRELYDLFVRDYTIKQWDKDPKELPSSIIKRLPVRLTYDTRYFEDSYQGQPINGYTDMIHNMLDGSDVCIGVDFHEDRKKWRKQAKKVVYTGPLDELYSYDEGSLPYRSINSVEEVHYTQDYQGIGQMNYTSLEHPYTRIVEYKHFQTDGPKLHKTIITKEFSTSNGEPYYPINNEINNLVAEAYKQRAKREGYLVCGRMANYQYFNMDQAIANAAKVAEEELHVQFA